MTRIEYIIDDDFLDDETKMSAESQGYLWELIRCKDCKYNSNTEGNYVNCNIIQQMFGKTPDDNYCSWAEPKEADG